MNLFEVLNSKIDEKSVQEVYNDLFKEEFKVSPNYYDGYIKCDGHFINKNINLLCEYKFDKDFTKNYEIVKVLIQVLYYLHKFEIEGIELPSIIFVGDKNECFCLSTNYLSKYLEESLDWSIAPSEAGYKNSKLLSKMCDDDVLLRQIYVYDIDNDFDINEIINTIKELSTGNIGYKTKVNEYNLPNIFKDFTNKVIKDKKLSHNDIVSIFIGILTNDENYYIRYIKSNRLCTSIKYLPEININENEYNKFINRIDRNYTIEEKLRFHEICDRLIENFTRRSKGEFYTPSIWANKAHELISQTFGKDWKEKYYVWDSCCGTKNLTRDYKFEHLYCSTLERSELDISKKYNKNSQSFICDFLNDDIEDILDTYAPGLLNALKKNLPIIFFINPPYLTAGLSSRGELSYQTKFNIGRASQELYCHFLCKIIEIKKKYNYTNNFNVCLFCKPKFLTGKSMNKFRSIWLTEFDYQNGFLINASEFGNVKGSWGISFSIWMSGETKDKNNFIHTLYKNQNGEIINIGEKTLYNLDNDQFIGDWCEEYKYKNTEEFPNRKSVFDYSQGKCKVSKESICYFTSGMNNLFILNSASYRGHFWNITKNNFNRFMIWNTISSIFKRNWINDKDDFKTPNIKNNNYQEFENDCIIYSIFGDNQSISLRNIEYHNKKWDIKNEFFWMSKESILNLLNEDGQEDPYIDCKNSNERYIYNLLKVLTISKEAQEVLNKATEIVNKTFKYRRLFNYDYPEYQIFNWDCGWYQIKKLCEIYCPEDLKEFNSLLKILENKMRPMIYELGFVK